MKRFVSLLLAVLMAAAVLSGCAKQPQTPETPQEEAVTIRVGGLKGPTSMGLVKLLDDAENQKTANAIDFQMAASANELNPLFLKGELDILAVPANLGSVLYNKTQGGVKMLAVSTLGVLYMVEKGGETVTDIKSLAGMTIYATGKGATPEYALTYLLARNGLELGKDVNVEWKSEPTEIVAQMAAQDSAVAMLPQPFVVVAMGQVEGLRVALDLTEQWNALGGDSQLITAVLLAVAAGRLRVLELLLWPYVTAIKSVPVASFIIICLIWMSTRQLAVFISFLMVFPVIYSNTLQGIKSADGALLEMARVYRVPFSRRLGYIYAPQVKPFLLSGCSVALGMSWKSGVAAEVIGVVGGSIGERLYEAKVYFQMTDLLAWTVVIVVCSVGFEKLVLWLLRRGFAAWEGR